MKNAMKSSQTSQPNDQPGEVEAADTSHSWPKPLLSVNNLAKTLNVSKRTVEKIIADGEIRPIWIRGQRRFHPETVDAYIRRMARGADR